MCVGELGAVLCLRGPAQADVEVAGRTLTVSLLTLDDAADLVAGDVLLVHSGFALARLTPEEAVEAERIREGDRP